MKQQQLVVFMFIFVLQLNNSECDLGISFHSDSFDFDVDIGSYRDSFVDSVNGIFKNAGTESTTDNIVSSTLQQTEQLSKVSVSELKGILKMPGAETTTDEPKKQSPHSEDRTATRRNVILDPTLYIQDVYGNNLNETFLNTETDGFTEPEKQMEYKPSAENLIIHMTSMTSPQLIAMHGYPAESHTIVTDDGYILTVHRIPYSKHTKPKTSPKKTVILHHGLLGSSADWLIPGPAKGLAYILSDAGYDVWMANVRGNTYSNAHVSRNVNSSEFWNFTFHEVSQHDLPAVIDYIMDIKGEGVKIDYIGHSMGTTVLFALLSTKTQYNKVLRAGFALAPVAYMTDIKSPIKLLAKYSDKIHTLVKLFGGANELLPANPVLNWLSKYSIELMSPGKEGILEDVMSILFGHDVGQFNKTLLPLIHAQMGSGASTKTVIHYAQEIKQSGKFQMFDYGPAGNMKVYGAVSPPEYPVHKITLPIALFSSENDWLSSIKDAKILYKRLVNPIDHYVVPLKEFNHADFLWAIDAPTLLYARLLQLLDQDVSKLDSSVVSLDDNDNNLVDNIDVATEKN